ncbi:TrkA family potassium uptake protein [bacterium]|nr:TrkA family potassium uptake protein [bacterium]
MQIVVIGLGTFGMKIVRVLSEQGAEVIAIDRDSEKVEAIKDQAAMALILDSTNESAMRSAKIEGVDAAVVALGNAQEEAILTTVILKEMGIFPVIARAANALYARVLKRVGADQIIIIEEQMGDTIAKKLLAPGIHERIHLSTGHSLVELEAPKAFIGKTLKELSIRARFGVNVIAIQKRITQIDNDGKVIETMVHNDLPGPTDIIEAGNTLVVVGEERDIEAMALSPEGGRA